MHITFLGTRGFIKVRTQQHFRHTATLLSYNRTFIMIDCGLDWVDEVWSINPNAIVITHAHADHAFGLKKGSPCPVYATEQSWDTMHHFPLKSSNRITIVPRVPFALGPFTLEPFTAIHSIRALAVGYRISAGQTTIFCVHDLIALEERHEALVGISLYIGDGASPVRPLIHRRDAMLFGHTSISTQLTWCKKEEVPRAIFTHCGSQIVNADPVIIERRIEDLAAKRGVKASLAFDGMKIRV
jgi:phosphoribosyl 1,2-cyclic phosphodiesterase